MDTIDYIVISILFLLLMLIADWDYRKLQEANHEIIQKLEVIVEIEELRNELLELNVNYERCLNFMARHQITQDY